MLMPATAMNQLFTKQLNSCFIGGCLILASLVGSARQARAAANLQIGYSHPVVKDMPAGIKVATPF
jgi:large subunit ribosomal protein L6